MTDLEHKRLNFPARFVIKLAATFTCGESNEPEATNMAFPVGRNVLCLQRFRVERMR
jgi:hypothetical protein